MEKYIDHCGKVNIKELEEQLQTNNQVKDEIYKIDKIGYTGKEREMIHFIRILGIKFTDNTDDALKILLDNMDEKYIGESFEDNFIEVFFNDAQMSSHSKLSNSMSNVIPSLVNLLVKNGVNSDAFIIKLMNHILLKSRTDFGGENIKKYLFQYIKEAHKKKPTDLTTLLMKKMDGSKSKSRMKKRKSKRKSVVRKSVRKRNINERRKNNQ